MIRYFGTAMALKSFSVSSHTKKMYRFLGNSLGAKKRSDTGLSTEYIERAKWILNLFNQFGVSLDNSRFLELGTGWIHWESTILSLFGNSEFTLFDVWDNRQLDAFKSYFSSLNTVFEEVFGREESLNPAQYEQARAKLGKIASMNAYAQLYDFLKFNYIVEPSGKLHHLEDDSYEACFSWNVFEHIHESIVSDYIRDLYRALKPGGYSFQAINISDHLADYEEGVCRKNYLKYSDFTWKFCFENDVQYFNRIQASEWLRLFQQAGFELLEKDFLFQPVHCRINKKYENLDRKDIECTMLKVVHRKPS